MRIPSVFDALSVISRRHDDSIPSADGAASGVTPTWRVYGGIQGSRRG